MLPKKGQVVHCRGCKKDLYKWTKDIQIGDPVTVNLLDVIGDTPPPKTGEVIACPYCKQQLDIR